jgi:hypothetical protein
MKLLRSIHLKRWLLLFLLFLTGCDAVKDFGAGLGNAFSKIKLP